MKEGKKFQQEERKVRKTTRSSKGDFTEGRLAELEPRWNNKTTQNGTSPWGSYMTIGGVLAVRTTLQNG
jgi:hypothetical protein